MASNSETLISQLRDGERNDRHNVLIACTGSVASLKIPEIVSRLAEFVNVRVVSTEHALHFFDHTSLPVICYRDSDEWSSWQQRGDPVVHIDLRRWADILVIAPLDANTLAKLASGICDNLLTCIVRAWDLARPLIFAPAMNTFMWEHPFTAKQIEQLCDLGYVYLPTIEKTLVCGDKGLGAMASVETIVQAVLSAVAKCDRQTTTLHEENKTL